MTRSLAGADHWATARGLDDALPAAHRFAPTQVDPCTLLELYLPSGDITTVLGATGFRSDHCRLDLPYVTAPAPATGWAPRAAPPETHSPSHRPTQPTCAGSSPK